LIGVIDRRHRHFRYSSLLIDLNDDAMVERA
jgi:hypothetical protein